MVGGERKRRKSSHFLRRAYTGRLCQSSAVATDGCSDLASSGRQGDGQKSHHGQNVHGSDRGQNIRKDLVVIMDRIFVRIWQ